MNDLRRLPNIGASLVSELMASGIATAEDLVKAGSVHAAKQLKAHGFSICANKLCALEGAVRDLRWHDIPPRERQTLWDAFREQTGSELG